MPNAKCLCCLPERGEGITLLERWTPILTWTSLCFCTPAAATAVEQPLSWAKMCILWSRGISTTSLKGNSHANKQNWPGGRASEVLGHPEGLLSWGDLLGMEYLGGYRGRGDQMPYRLRLQEEEPPTGSISGSGFWWLTIDGLSSKQWKREPQNPSGQVRPELACSKQVLCIISCTHA